MRDSFTFDGSEFEPVFEEWTEGGGVTKRDVFRGGYDATDDSEDDGTDGDDGDDEDDASDVDDGYDREDEKDEKANEEKDGPEKPNTSSYPRPGLPPSHYTSPLPNDKNNIERSPTINSNQTEPHNSGSEYELDGPVYPFGCRLSALPHRGLETR